MDDMVICLNGATQHLTTGACVQDLIDSLALGKARFAVEVNGSLVPRSTYAAHQLQEDDQIEIVHAIGWG